MLGADAGMAERAEAQRRALELAASDAHGAGVLKGPFGGYCRDRIAWALYYDRLGYPEKARLLLVAALKDLMSLLESTAESAADYGHVRAVNKAVSERIAEIEMTRGNDDGPQSPSVAELVWATSSADGSAAPPPPVATSLYHTAQARAPQQLARLKQRLVSRFSGARAHESKRDARHVVQCGTLRRNAVEGHAAAAFRDTFRRRTDLYAQICTDAAKIAEGISLHDAALGELRQPVEASLRAVRIPRPQLVDFRADYGFLGDIIADLIAQGDTGAPSSGGTRGEVMLTAMEQQHLHELLLALTTTPGIRLADVQAISEDLCRRLRLTSGTRAALWARVSNETNRAAFLCTLADTALLQFADRAASASPDDFEKVADYALWRAAVTTRLATAPLPPTRPPPQPRPTPVGLPPDPRHAHRIATALAYILFPPTLLASVAATEAGDEERVDVAFSWRFAALLHYCARAGVGFQFLYITLLGIFAPSWRAHPNICCWVADLLERLAALSRREPSNMAEHRALTAITQRLAQACDLVMHDFRQLDMSLEALDAVLLLLQRLAPFDAQAEAMKSDADRSSAIVPATTRFMSRLRHVVLAKMPAPQRQTDFLTPAQLYAFVDAIAEAWRHDERVYAPVFHSSVNYLAVVRSLYFQRITSELRAMADALEGDAKRPDAGLLLDTYVIVAGIMDEASMHRFLGWPGIADLFLDAIRAWIDALPSALQNWTKDAIRRDSFEAVSETEPRTSSVIDMFSMIDEVGAYVGKFAALDDYSRDRQELAVGLASAVAKTVVFYVQQMGDKALRTLALIAKAEQGWSRVKPLRLNAPSSIQGRLAEVGQRLISRPLHKVPGRQAWTLTRRRGAASTSDTLRSFPVQLADEMCLLCLQVNDVESTRMYLEDVVAQFQLDSASRPARAQGFADAMQVAFDAARTKLSALVHAIAASMQPVLASFAAAIVEAGFVREPVYALYAFLNKYLELFADTLHDQTMTRLARRILGVLVEALDARLKRVRARDMAADAESCFQAFCASLRVFFCADGDGVPAATIDRELARLKLPQLK